MNFIKRHYKKIIGIAVVCLILVAAYWYGGNAPGSTGFYSDKSEDTVAENSEDSEDAFESTSEEITTEEIAANVNEDSFDYAISEDEENDDIDSTEETTTEEVTTEETTTEETKTEETTTEKATTESSNSDEEDKKAEDDAKKNATEQSTENEEIYTCTISINCGNILNNMELLDDSKTSCVPSDGWILGSTEVEFSEGETVFDVLQKVTKDNNIHLEYSYSAIYGCTYIEGINNIYEFDCGELSGWEYSVNGNFPNYGSSKYVLSDGDTIAWIYTCDLGADVGNEY